VKNYCFFLHSTSTKRKNWGKKAQLTDRMSVMTSLRLICISIFIGFTLSLNALPVAFGSLEIGLESFDGYQEGLAYVSSDESGSVLEIRIKYKGFGLDTVTWTFSEDDISALRTAAADSAWWRSRLLEMNIDQTVIREAATVSPSLTYSYRGQLFPFESNEHVLRFVRQGRDYALLLTESPPGAETRRSGEKTLPIFTIHFSGREMPVFRDMVSEENFQIVLAEFAAEKASIEAILNSNPKSGS
jgi:hypothetical protein